MIKFKKKDKLIRDELSDIYEFLDNLMTDQKQIKDKIKKIYLDLTRFKYIWARTVN